MKTKTLTITEHEFVETKDGGYFKHSTRKETFPDEEGRHDNLCIVCGFSTYPECRKWCQHRGYDSDFK